MLPLASPFMVLEAQSHVLLSTGAELPLPDVIEEEVDHFTQAGNL